MLMAFVYIARDQLSYCGVEMHSIEHERRELQRCMSDRWTSIAINGAQQRPIVAQCHLSIYL